MNHEFRTRSHCHNNSYAVNLKICTFNDVKLNMNQSL